MHDFYGSSWIGLLSNGAQEGNRRHQAAAAAPAWVTAPWSTTQAHTVAEVVVKVLALSQSTATTATTATGAFPYNP